MYCYLVEKTVQYCKIDMSQVKKRETFYISGYDPRGARHYYNFYKIQSKEQSDINGIDMDISSRKRTSKYIQTWQINASSEDKYTQTNYNFLEWDDIIRENWKKNFFNFFIDIIFYLKTYILSGRFIKYSKISPYQMIALFSPIIYIILSIGFSCYISYYIDLFLNGLLGIVSALFLFVLSFYVLLKLADKLALFWLIRIFVFSGRYVFEDNEEIEDRLEYFSSYLVEKIKNAKKDGIDEILIVSHSVGAILTMPLLEKTLKKLDKNLDYNLSILVLGECIPLITCIDKAIEYKSQMKYVAQSKHLFWLDYTTIIDGACFPTLNYFEDIDIKIKYSNNFYFLSPRFYKLFSKQKYAKLRKNRYLAHFIYMMSTEYASSYDFFRLTAGHQYLRNTIK